MPRIDPRDEKMFPKLTVAEIDRLHRFGQLQHYNRKQPLFVTGELAPGMFVLKTGRVKVRRRDPLGHLAPIVEQLVISSLKWDSSQDGRRWSTL
jgi:thioredoxin reductase (NADPH)